jgi:hypothetical protein
MHSTYLNVRTSAWVGKSILRHLRSANEYTYRSLYQRVSRKACVGTETRTRGGGGQSVTDTQKGADTQETADKTKGAHRHDEDTWCARL